MGGPDLGFGDPNPRARRSTPWPSERTGTERETDRGRQTLLGTRPDPTVRCPTRAPGGGHGRRRSAAAKVAAPTAGDGSASFPTGGDQIRPTGGRIRWKEVELSSSSEFRCHASTSIYPPALPFKIVSGCYANEEVAVVDGKCMVQWLGSTTHIHVFILLDADDESLTMGLHNSKAD